jgi:acyl-coenzyme A thioesterase PaaI-like protein
MSASDAVSWEPVPNEFAKRVPGFKCFGCAPGHGLALEFMRPANGSPPQFESSASSPAVSSFHVVKTRPFVFADALQSFPGVAHGGALSMVIDDTAFWGLFSNTGALALTSSLQVKFKRPVSVKPDGGGTRLVAEATIIEFDRAGRKRAAVEVSVRNDSTGDEVCSGTVTFHLPPNNVALRKMFGKLVDDLPAARL